jgi:hypothetical protein
MDTGDIAYLLSRVCLQGASLLRGETCLVVVVITPKYLRLCKLYNVRV